MSFRGTMKAGTWGGRRYRAQIKSRQAEEREREKFIQKGIADLTSQMTTKLKIGQASGDARMPYRFQGEGGIGEDVGSNILTGAQISRRREIQQAVGSIPQFIDPSKMSEFRDKLGREYDAMIEESRATELGRTRFDGVIAMPEDEGGFDTEALVEQAQGVAPAQMIEDDEGNIVGQEYGTEAITIGQGALAVQQPAMDVVETYEPETKPDVYERWQAQKQAKAQMDIEARPSRKSGDDLSDLMGGMVVQSQLEKEVERRGLLRTPQLRPQDRHITDDISRQLLTEQRMGMPNMKFSRQPNQDLASQMGGMAIDLSLPSGERQNPALAGLMPNVLKQSTLNMQYNPMESREDRRKRLAQAGKLSIVQIADSERQIKDPSAPPLADTGVADTLTSLTIKMAKGEGTQSLIYGRGNYGAKGRTRPLGLYDQGVVDAQQAKTKKKTKLMYVDKDGNPVPKEVLDKIKSIPKSKGTPMSKKEHTESIYGKKVPVELVVQDTTGVPVDAYWGGARDHTHKPEKAKAKKRREARRKHLRYEETKQKADPEAYYNERVRFGYGGHGGYDDPVVSAKTEVSQARPASTATSHQAALSYGATEWHPPLNVGVAPQAQLEQIAPVGYVPIQYEGGGHDLSADALDREFSKDEIARTEVAEAYRSVAWMPDGKFKKKALAKKFRPKDATQYGKKEIEQKGKGVIGHQMIVKKKRKKKLPKGLANLAKGL